MVELWQKYASDGRYVSYRVKGNPTVGYVAMATVEGQPPSDQIQSKDKPTKADVEEQFASYVRGTKKDS